MALIVFFIQQELGARLKSSRTLEKEWQTRNFFVIVLLVDIEDADVY